MNERIRELVGRAGGIGHDDDGNELTPALVGKGLEKFAELIVKECMELGDKALQDGKWPGDVLKEHFGVEI